MTILLPVLGIGVAAFYTWLGVRIVNRRERWAMWTAIATAGALVASYVIAYVCIVDSMAVASTPNPPILPFYRISGWVQTDRYSERFLARFFAPAHWLDRKVRRNLWEWDDEDTPVDDSDLPDAATNAP